jgi:UDP-N-acetyl-D-glucosamine dehydrogenase
VLVLGIAYKANVDDMRESPSVELMKLLDQKGAIVNYSDPHVSVFPKMRDYYFDLRSVELTSQSIKDFDCVLIATNHKAFDYELIKAHAQLIVDTRGVYKESFDELIRA